VDSCSLWRRWVLAVPAAVLLTPAAALADSRLVIAPSSLARCLASGTFSCARAVN
jgi:hypothetical protein